MASHRPARLESVPRSMSVKSGTRAGVKSWPRSTPLKNTPAITVHSIDTGSKARRGGAPEGVRHPPPEGPGARHFRDQIRNRVQLRAGLIPGKRNQRDVLQL